MAIQIRARRAIQVTKSRGNAAVFLVSYKKGVKLPVVYDRSSHTISTVLPKNDPRVSRFFNGGKKAVKPKPPERKSKFYVNRNGNGKKR